MKASSQTAHGRVPQQLFAATSPPPHPPPPPAFQGSMYNLAGLGINVSVWSQILGLWGFSAICLGSTRPSPWHDQGLGFDAK